MIHIESNLEEINKVKVLLENKPVKTMKDLIEAIKQAKKREKTCELI